MRGESHLPVAGLRRKFTIAMAVTAVVLLTCYAYSAFLFYRRNHPAVQVSVKPVTSAESSPDESLASAARLLKDHKVEQALVAYRAALARHPKNVRVQVGVAEAELSAGREADAAREFERVLKLDPAHRQALTQLGRIYSHSRETWPEAEARYRQYLKVQTNDGAVMLGLARVVAWQGKAAEAATLFGKPEVARLMTPTDNRDYVFALAKCGRYNDAEPLLKKLIAQNPSDLDLSLQLGSIYASRKDWTNALPLYRGLIAKRPNDSQLQLTYGLGLLATRNYRGALAPLARARNAMPSSGEAGLGYARALKGAGELKDASREFARVLPQYHRNGPIVREYADLMLERKDYKKAAEQYRVAYDLGVTDNRTLTGLAGSLTGDGKYKAALPYLEEAYRRAPTSRLAFEIARVLKKMNRNQQAMVYLQKVQSSSTGAEMRR
jgi:tetratricopeptide (TPR) repeat protein